MIADDKNEPLDRKRHNPSVSMESSNDKTLLINRIMDYFDIMVLTYIPSSSKISKRSYLSDDKLNIIKQKGKAKKMKK